MWTKERIRLLEDGESVIYEVGIEAVLKNNLDAGRLRFTMDMKSAVSGSEIVFIAVGTPLPRRWPGRPLPGDRGGGDA